MLTATASARLICVAAACGTWYSDHKPSPSPPMLLVPQHIAIPTAHAARAPVREADRGPAGLGADLRRDVRIGGGVVDELRAAVEAPAPQGTVDEDRAGQQVAGDDHRGRSRRRDRPRCRDRRRGRVAGLVMVVVAPAQHAHRRADPAGVIVAGGDLRPVGERADLHRDPGAGRAALRARAPAPQRARGQRAGLVAAGGHVIEDRRRSGERRRGRKVERGAHATGDLAVGVLAPAPHRPVVRDRARVFRSDRELGPLHPGIADECRRRGLRTRDAQLPDVVVAPAPDRTVDVEPAHVTRAHAERREVDRRRRARAIGPAAHVLGGAHEVAGARVGAHDPTRVERGLVAAPEGGDDDHEP